MQTQVLFEHPLNEKMRTWLRIEFLIQQLTVNLPIADHAGALHFFRKRFHFRHPFPTAFRSRKDFSILPDDYSCKNTTGSRAISSACFSGMV